MGYNLEFEVAQAADSIVAVLEVVDRLIELENIEGVEVEHRFVVVEAVFAEV